MVLKVGMKIGLFNKNVNRQSTKIALETTSENENQPYENKFSQWINEGEYLAETK